MNIKDISRVVGSVVVSSVLLLGGAGLAFAQTYDTSGSATVTPAATGSATTGSTSSSGTTGTTPGVPNTGAGGDQAGNLALLGVAAVVAIGGAAYLARQKYSAN